VRDAIAEERSLFFYSFWESSWSDGSHCRQLQFWRLCCLSSSFQPSLPPTRYYLVCLYIRTDRCDKNITVDNVVVVALYAGVASLWIYNFSHVSASINPFRFFVFPFCHGVLWWRRWEILEFSLWESRVRSSAAVSFFCDIMGNAVSHAFVRLFSPSQINSKW
jgi:hypothetical protein